MPATGAMLARERQKAILKRVQQDGTVRVTDLAWSPDQRYLAFTHTAYGDAAGKGAGVELWLVDVAARSAKRLTAQPLSVVFSRGFQWQPDGKGLLVQLRPAGQGPAPRITGIPSGPATQDSQPGANRFGPNPKGVIGAGTPSPIIVRDW